VKYQLSALTHSTIASFFTRYGKKSREDEISIVQAVMCLEAELGRPDIKKKRLDANDTMDSSASATHVMFVAGQRGEEVALVLDNFPPSTRRRFGERLGRQTPGTRSVCDRHQQTMENMIYRFINHTLSA